MTLFKNFVESGRLAIGRFGSVLDKPVVVVDIVDLKRVIVVDPESRARVLLPLRRLALTEFKVELKRGASIGDVEEALAADNVVAQWRETAWGKKRASYYARRSITDFDRFRYSRAQSYVEAQLPHILFPFGRSSFKR